MITTTIFDFCKLNYIVKMFALIKNSYHAVYDMVPDTYLIPIMLN